MVFLIGLFQDCVKIQEKGKFDLDSEKTSVLLDKICEVSRINGIFTALTLRTLSELKIDWNAFSLDQSHQLINAIKSHARDFNPQGIANSLNALSKMDTSWECV